MRARSTTPPRGSTLLTTVILIAILTVVGVAAVALSSQERRNAGAKARVDASQACANAAMAQIWKEMQTYGLGYLGTSMPVAEVTLPDGTRLQSPAHMDQPSGTLVSQVVLKVESVSAGGDERDLTNRIAGSEGLGHTYAVTARCSTQSGRESEVEVGLKFAL
jgi:hypothetical protein